MRRRTIGFELENLHDCAAGERVDNSSSGGLNNNRCLTHPLPRETLDLFPKLVTGNSKQRPVVLLNLCGPSLGASQDLLSRSQRFVQCQHDSVFARDHGHRLWHVARSLCLHRHGDLRKFFGKERWRRVVCHSGGLRG